MRSQVHLFFRPDASPLPKKKRVHSPAPVPKATEEEDAVEDDDAGIASMPRRSYVFPFCSNLWANLTQAS